MNKRIVFLFLLISLKLTAVAVHAQSVQYRPKVYAYHVDPSVYPDYKRRPFRTPDWNTFNNMVQFVGGRSWNGGNPSMESPPNWIPGASVFRPNFSNFNMTPDSLRRSLMFLKETGKYLFNINAYGPGTPVTGSFGQFAVEEWKRDMMRDVLEDRYMGFDLGEQDGRYWADARSVDYPMTFDYKERYLRQSKYMHKAARDQGSIISMLSVKGFWHYPMKDGYITISGAESQHKTHTSNNQVHYAFIRGASKQYGLLWYGDISVFNTWGYKTYANRSSENAGPLKGNSLAWMRRMLFSQYQYNSAILGFESSKFYEGATDTARLSPIGQLQIDAQEFVKNNPKPGPQYTPIAILQDFFSGWMTPSVPFRQLYKVWNYLPYQQDDYLLHNLLNKFYPGYDKAGLNKNEYGSLSSTPYGDIVDALLTDVSEAVLQQYGLVILTSTVKENSQELADKLLPYVEKGGHVILSGENAKSLFPDLFSPNYDTGFHVLNKAIGKGELSFVFNGLKKEQAGSVLNDRFSSFLDEVFKRHRILSVANDSLAYITNIEKDSTFLIGLYNNTLQQQPFQINSHIGKIGEITEVNLTRSFEKELGYFPEGFSNCGADADGPGFLQPGDVRFFKVKIETPTVDYLQKSVHKPIVRDTYLEVHSLIGLPRTLQLIPGFYDLVSGLKVNWLAFTAIDSFAWREDNWWYNLKRTQWAVEIDEEFSSKEALDPTLFPSILSKLKIIKERPLIILADKVYPNLAARFKRELPAAVVVKRSLYRKVMVSAVKQDGNLENWPVLYGRISKNKNIQIPIVYSLQKKREATNSKPPLVSTRDSSFFFAYHGIESDVSAFISLNSNILREFGGVKLDGNYLLNRSEEKCKTEGAILKRMGYNVIIDLSRELNNYPDLTWLSELDGSYQRTVYIFENMLKKMKLMGAGKIIISSHMRPEMWKFENRTPEQSIEAGMAAFIALANSYKIDVYLQNMSHEFYPGRLLAKPAEVTRLVQSLNAKFGNVGFAANWGVVQHPGQVWQHSDKADMQIVATRGSDLVDYQIPASRVLGSITLEAAKTSLFIFDADYSNLSELLTEKKWLEHNLKN